MLVSNDRGATWSKAGDLPRDVRPLMLAASSHDRSVYFGAVDLHRTTDDGVTWQTVATHPDQHAIAFDPVKPSRVWLGNDGGLWISNDDGATVQSLANRLPVIQFYNVNAHPTDPGLLFGGSQDNGLEAMTAAGASELVGGDYGTTLFDPATSRILANSLGWFMVRIGRNGADNPVAVTDASTFGDPNRMAFIPPMVRGSDGTVWFGTYRLFASHDFGATWTAPAGTLDLTTGMKIGSLYDVLSAVAVSESSPQTLYTASSLGRVMLTHDAAVTWSDITPQNSQPVGAIAISRAAANVAYVAFTGYGSPRLMKTIDFGQTWRDAGSGLPRMPVNAVYIDTRDPSVLYAGTDIGVFRSGDAGATWSPFDNGMPPVIVTSFTTTAEGRLIAGTYGRGAYQLVEDEPPGAPRHRSAHH